MDYSLVPFISIISKAMKASHITLFSQERGLQGLKRHKARLVKKNTAEIHMGLKEMHNILK